MTLTVTIYTGCMAMAAALARVTASWRPYRFTAASDVERGAPATAAAAESGEPAFYMLEVAFTPYGPEILQFWVPYSVSSHLHDGIRKGDIQ